jgi:uncharacterized integral membrane protein (TIGR00697 family)
MLNKINSHKNNFDSCLIFLSMLYMSIMLFNAILTNRYISLGSYFVLGGTFTSPLIFLLGDLVAENYGYEVTKRFIYFGFLCQTLFSIFCEIVIYSPSPSFWSDKNLYIQIFQPLFFLNISSFAAFILSGLLNAKLITKWKVLLRGRFFWIRSLGASTIAEALYSLIAICIMELRNLSMKNIISVIILSYLIKVTYSVIFAFPANYISKIIKIYQVSRGTT